MLKKLFSIIALAFCATPATSEEMARMQLLPGWANSDGSYVFGVEIALQPGWKTYWRAPGGNGIPPQFDWTGSRNVGTIQIHWPSPKVMDSYGFKTVGYAENVVFPIQVNPQNRGQPVTVSLNLFYGVCKEVCIPANSSAKLALQDGSQISKTLIRDALARHVLNEREAGVRSVVCDIIPSDKGFNMSAKVSMRNAPGTNPYAVVETGNDNLIVMPVSGESHGNHVQFATEASYYGSSGMIVDRSQLTITLLFADQVIELRGCPA